MPRKSADREVRESRAEIAESIPRKPARTLRVRIAEIGPHHIEAFDLVAAKDESFEASVRLAMDCVEFATAKGVELAMAKAALVLAEAEFQKAQDDIKRTSKTLDRLNAKAALVARLHDDTPEADEDFGPSDPGAVPDEFDRDPTFERPRAITRPENVHAPISPGDRDPRQ